MHHIDPSLPRHKPSPSDPDYEQWVTLDATVLQWIYSTISIDLLRTIMQRGSTAQEIWTRLANIFQDNQNARAVTLEQEFPSTRMEDFSNVSAYCQRLKTLSDQLADVGAPVSNHRLVLQLISGLTGAYHGVATLIRQSNPLPLFYQARSMLTLEEAGLAQMASTESPSTYHTTPQRAPVERPPADTSQTSNRRSGNRSRSRSTQRRSKNRGNCSGSRSSGAPTPPSRAPPSWHP